MDTNVYVHLVQRAHAAFLKSLRASQTLAMLAFVDIILKRGLDSLVTAAMAGKELTVMSPRVIIQFVKMVVKLSHRYIRIQTSPPVAVNAPKDSLENIAK